ncbi:transcriptional regulator, HxlR family [Seinonella peptonophila]|uniref:Transcriptional regulator, HxlR family n=1 Tax=Seinonella peptonophila TaxID=112248 RepID=A0A1M4WN50_9BACL|nr:helix-turn-helix domain-containing protein [Seinonella peptonophila]SHE82590.1 transcriptional regulator, HxlR family [Seinonella peptonophila]
MSKLKKKYRSGIEAALEVIGGKWKGIVYYHLSHGKKRTQELNRLIPTITRKMLVKQLRELERDGIVERTVYAEVPPRVEYELTDYGQSLKPVLNTFCEWGESHLEQVYGDKNHVLDQFSDLNHC